MAVIVKTISKWFFPAGMCRKRNISRGVKKGELLIDLLIPYIKQLCIFFLAYRLLLKLLTVEFVMPSEV